MKVNNWLAGATKKLNSSNVSTARLDSLVLLSDAFSKDKAWLLANPDFETKGPTLELLNKQIERRCNHEPLAYIRGKSEFFGRDFKVTPATLQPRPETESLIELFAENSKGIKTVIDVGTGSGAIAITIKLENPDLAVFATELNSDALEIAKQNADSLKASVRLHQGDLLNPLLSNDYQAPSAVLANLPYVPDSHTINEAAMHEPKVAIFGGEDGLDLYRRMFDQINHLMHKPNLVLTESLPFQHKELKSIAANYGYALSATNDFIQLFTLR